MQLEDFLDFDDDGAIRVKGTRVQIDTVIGDYLAGYLPEQIASNYRTLTLEVVFAVLAYYLHNKEELDQHLARNKEACDAAYQRYLAEEPSAVVKRLRERSAESRV